MRQIRKEAYGEDIGQHSWVSAAELRAHMKDLNLSSDSMVLDFGCGPCGPLTFLAKETGCKMVGIDLSAAALTAGTTQAQELGVSDSIELRQADGNSPLEFEHKFDAIVAFDVVLHLRNRAVVFERFPSLLRPKGKLLITDAGILTGPISNEEVYLRSVNGFTQFAPIGFNEAILESCGFKVLAVRDLTDGVIQNASGRLRARQNHSEELIQIEGPDTFDEQQKYLEVLILLSQRKALSRFAYLVELES